MDIFTNVLCNRHRFRSRSNSRKKGRGHFLGIPRSWSMGLAQNIELKYGNVLVRPYTILMTVDPCSGREATSPLATILALESLTISQTQANQLNQSNEDDLARVDQIAQNDELESGHSLGVEGTLKNNLRFWRSLGVPDFILSVIENGYKLPFISFALAVKLRNNKSARLHADFVDQAVLELVNSGRLRMFKEQPFVVNPLSVSIQPCSKKRLILDLRHVNKSLIKQSV